MNINLRKRARPINKTCLMAILAVFILGWPSTVLAGVFVVNAASANTGTGTSTSLTIPSFTVSDADTMLILGVTIRGSSTVSMATYGTSSFTSIGSVNNGTTIRVQLYRLMNPPNGTANITVGLSSAARFVAGV